MAAIVMAVLAAACSGGEEAAPELAAEEILSRSVAAVGELSSFHFRLGHENGSTRIPLNLELKSAEGDVVLPDRTGAASTPPGAPLSDHPSAPPSGRPG